MIIFATFVTVTRKEKMVFMHAVSLTQLVIMTAVQLALRETTRLSLKTLQK
jgi:hypothetical protein